MLKQSKAKERELEAVGVVESGEGLVNSLDRYIERDVYLERHTFDLMAFVVNRFQGNLHMLQAVVAENRADDRCPE